MRITAFLAALLLVPVGSAADMVVSSADAWRVDGAVAVRGAEGSLVVASDGQTSTGALTGATGTVTVWRWRLVSVAGGDVRQPAADASEERFAVDGATIGLAHANERQTFAVVLDGDGVLSVLGEIHADGVPRRLAEDVEPYAVRTPSAFRAWESSQWRWQRGWAYVGEFPSLVELPSGPVPEAATLGVQGDVVLLAASGNLTFVDAEGARHAVELGVRADDGPRLPGVVGTETWTRAVFRGRVADAALPIGPGWVLAGPALGWAVDGVVRWTNATGHVQGDGDRVDFEAATVEASLAASFTVEPAAGLASTGPTTYRGEGRVRGLAVDGVPAAPAPPVPAALAWAGVAAALAAAAALAFYTRLTPADVLENDVRRRIYEATVAGPRVHKRELQRRLGIAWGVFLFHVRVLERAGFVTVEKAGRYTVLSASCAGRCGEPALPHAVLRQVFDGVPTTGAVPIPDLARSLGLSRQLVGYHVRTLERRGLVRVERAGPRTRLVARS